MATHTVKIRYATDIAGLQSARHELYKLENILDEIEADPLKLKMHDPKELDLLRKQIKEINHLLAVGHKRGAAAWDGYNRGAKAANKLQFQLAAAHAAVIRKIEEQEKAMRRLNRQEQNRASLLDRTRRALGQSFLEAPLYTASFAVMAGIGQAIKDFIEFDKVMTRIAIVTDRSLESMKSYGQYVNDLGNQLGVTGQQMAEASLTFLQQGGLAADYATSLGAASIKLANITGTQAEDTSEYITTIANSFNILESDGVAAGDRIVDVLAAVEAASGSSADEIAKAFKKSASSFAAAGFTMEQGTAILATISEVTRQAPELIGTGMKTLIGNLSEIRVGSKEFEGLTNKVQDITKEFGFSFSLMDERTGDMKPIPKLLEEIAELYNKIGSEEAKRALIEAVAGKEQRDRFIALIENQDTYNRLLNTAEDSAGKADEAQQKYLDSVAGKLGQLKNEWEQTILSVFDTQAFKDLIDVLRLTLVQFNMLIESGNGFAQILENIAQLLITFGVLKVAGGFFSKVKTGALQGGGFLGSVLNAAAPVMAAGSRFITNAQNKGLKSAIGGGLKTVGKAVALPAIGAGIGAAMDINDIVTTNEYSGRQKFDLSLNALFPVLTTIVGTLVGGPMGSALGYAAGQAFKSFVLDPKTAKKFEYRMGAMQEIKAIDSIVTENMMNYGKEIEELAEIVTIPGIDKSSQLYIDSANRLAELMPHLSTSQDEYGNAVLRTNAEIIKSIELKKEELRLQNELAGGPEAGAKNIALAAEAEAETDKRRKDQEDAAKEEKKAMDKFDEVTKERNSQVEKQYELEQKIARLEELREKKKSGTMSDEETQELTELSKGAGGFYQSLSITKAEVAKLDKDLADAGKEYETAKLKTQVAVNRVSQSEAYAADVYREESIKAFEARLGDQFTDKDQLAKIMAAFRRTTADGKLELGNMEFLSEADAKEFQTAMQTVIDTYKSGESLENIDFTALDMIIAKHAPNMERFGTIFNQERAALDKYLKDQDNLEELFTTSFDDLQAKVTDEFNLDEYDLSQFDYFTKLADILINNFDAMDEKFQDLKVEDTFKEIFEEFNVALDNVAGDYSSKLLSIDIDKGTTERLFEMFKEEVVDKSQAYAFLIEAASKLSDAREALDAALASDGILTSEEEDAIFAAGDGLIKKIQRKVAGTNIDVNTPLGQMLYNDGRKLSYSILADEEEIGRRMVESSQRGPYETDDDKKVKERDWLADILATYNSQRAEMEEEIALAQKHLATLDESDANYGIISAKITKLQGEYNAKFSEQNSNMIDMINDYMTNVLKFTDEEVKRLQDKWEAGTATIAEKERLEEYTRATGAIKGLIESKTQLIDMTSILQGLQAEEQILDKNTRAYDRNVESQIDYARAMYDANQISIKSVQDLLLSEGLSFEKRKEYQEELNTLYGIQAGLLGEAKSDTDVLLEKNARAAADIMNLMAGTTGDVRLGFQKELNKITANMTELMEKDTKELSGIEDKIKRLDIVNAAIAEIESKGPPTNQSQAERYARLIQERDAIDRETLEEQKSIVEGRLRVNRDIFAAAQLEQYADNIVKLSNEQSDIAEGTESFTGNLQGQTEEMKKSLSVVQNQIVDYERLRDLYGLTEEQQMKLNGLYSEEVRIKGDILSLDERIAANRQKVIGRAAFEAANIIERMKTETPEEQVKSQAELDLLGAQINAQIAPDATRLGVVDAAIAEFEAGVASNKSISQESRDRYERLKEERDSLRTRISLNKQLYNTALIQQFQDNIEKLKNEQSKLTEGTKEYTDNLIKQKKESIETLSLVGKSIEYYENEKKARELTTEEQDDYNKLLAQESGLLQERIDYDRQIAESRARGYRDRVTELETNIAKLESELQNRIEQSENYLNAQDLIIEQQKQIFTENRGRLSEIQGYLNETNLSEEVKKDYLNEQNELYIKQRDLMKQINDSVKKRAVDEYNISLYGTANIEALQTQYEIRQQLLDEIIDTHESLIERTQFELEIQKEIENSTNETYKTNLRYVQNKLKDTKLTKQVLDSTRAQINLLKVLSEEQASGAFRLTRSPAGQYRFAASASEAEGAREASLKAAADYEKESIDRYREISENVFNLQQQIAQMKIGEEDTVRAESLLVELQRQQEAQGEKIQEAKAASALIAMGRSQVAARLTAGRIDVEEALRFLSPEQQAAVRTSAQGELSGVLSSQQLLIQSNFDIVTSNNTLKDALDRLSAKLESMITSASLSVPGGNAPAPTSQPQSEPAPGPTSTKSNFYESQGLEANTVGYLDGTAVVRYISSKPLDKKYYEQLQEALKSDSNFKQSEIQRAKNVLAFYGPENDIGRGASAYLKSLEAFQTGGYTGDFLGGKVAVLHEKELVLNKVDTKNILEAVSIARSMPKLFNKFSPTFSSEGGKNQSVVINAEFPNVSSADEIKKAFASMSSKALQYAYSTKSY